MRNQPDDSDSQLPIAKKLVEGLVGVGGGAIAGPLGGTAAVVAAGEAFDQVVSAVERRRARNVVAALAQAGERAQMDVQAMVNQMLDHTPERYELLIETLSFAGNTGSMRKLIAAANALGEVAAAPNAEESGVARSRAVVRALAEVDATHLRVLRTLTLSPREAGWSEGNEPLECLNRTQVELALPGLAGMLDPLLSVLTRHGLVRYFRSSGGLFGGGGLSDAVEVTEFGRELLTRLDSVREALT